MSEDCCFIHGHEFIERQFGNPIAYCSRCEQERQMNEEKATIERDVWTAYFDRRKQELIKEGMSPEEADNAAFREVRREIHGGR